MSALSVGFRRSVDRGALAGAPSLGEQNVMKYRLLIGATALFVAAAGSALAVAQAQAPAAAKSIWNGVYTQEQATRGETAYQANCARCHGPQLAGDARFRALQGDVWAGRWDTRGVDALLKFVSTNMPNGAGGSLPPATYQDLVAFILSRNGFPAGAAQLTMDSAAGVQIIGRDGVPRPLADKTIAGVVGCLAKGGPNGWYVTNATFPRRLEDTKVPDDAATVTLGGAEDEVQLKFVIASLDRNVGQRVFVRGLLIGENGADGINVTEVRSVGMTCP
jgi:cytochrome c5